MRGVSRFVAQRLSFVLLRLFSTVVACSKRPPRTGESVRGLFAARDCAIDLPRNAGLPFGCEQTCATLKCPPFQGKVGLSRAFGVRIAPYVEDTVFAWPVDHLSYFRPLKGGAL